MKRWLERWLNNRIFGIEEKNLSRRGWLFQTYSTEKLFKNAKQLENRKVWHVIYKDYVRLLYLSEYLQTKQIRVQKHKILIEGNCHLSTLYPAKTSNKAYNTKTFHSKQILTELSTTQPAPPEMQRQLQAKN